MLLNELCYETSSQTHFNPSGDETQPEYVVGIKRLWENAVVKPAGAESDHAHSVVESSLTSSRRSLRSRTRRTAEHPISELRRRLDYANQHFRRKAAAVLRDKDAVLLLASLYKQSNMRVQDFDTCTFGVSLAKLAAANFCDIGSQSIYITTAGREFIESIAKS